MINLDQVRTLEWKVKQAVQLVAHLRRENDTLRGRLSDTEVRLQELESLLETVKAGQSEMESGIRNALEELDFLEDAPSVVSEAAGQVDQFLYPPAPAAASPDVPSAAPEVSREPAEETLEGGDAAFEEEFAALAAAEAAALAEQDAPPQEVPASVELESEDSLPVPEDEREPEQPGLGIF